MRVGVNVERWFRFVSYLCLSLCHTLTHTHTHTHTNTNTHTQTNKHTHTHTPHTQTNKHKHTHTHTHPTLPAKLLGHSEPRPAGLGILLVRLLPALGRLHRRILGIVHAAHLITRRVERQQHLLAELRDVVDDVVHVLQGHGGRNLRIVLLAVQHLGEHKLDVTHGRLEGRGEGSHRGVQQSSAATESGRVGAQGRGEHFLCGV